MTSFCEPQSIKTEGLHTVDRRMSRIRLLFTNVRVIFEKLDIYRFLLMDLSHNISFRTSTHQTGYQMKQQSSSLVSIICLTLAGGMRTCEGFATPTRPALSTLKTTTLYESNTDNNVEINNEPEPIARQARVITPINTMMAMMGALTAEVPVFPALAAPEQNFDAALNRYFPGSLTSSAVALRVASSLLKRDYGPKNVLLGSSLCSDEINYVPDSLTTSLNKRLCNQKNGGVFNLGGLGGLPFVGTSGFGAFASHCPEQGNIVIVFGPHVGISEKGVVGKVKRIGMKDVSTSCGAAIGGYKAIAAAQNNPPKKDGKSGIKPFDAQEEYIIGELKKKLGNLAGLEAKGGDAVNTLVTKDMYEICQDLLMDIMQSATYKPGFWNKVNEITLIGGIVINRDPQGGEDAFQPILFRSINQNGVNNMYDDVFGDLRFTRVYS